MRACGKQREVVDVVVDDEAVDGGELRQFIFGVGAHFDVGGDVDFAARPRFDGDGALRRAVESERRAVAEASEFVARRGACECWQRERGRRKGRAVVGLLILLLLLRVDVGGRAADEEHRGDDERASDVCEKSDGEVEALIHARHLSDMKTDATQSARLLRASGSCRLRCVDISNGA